MTLDLHANLSQKMADHTHAIVVYRTNPHMDAQRAGDRRVRDPGAHDAGEIQPVECAGDAADGHQHPAPGYSRRANARA